MHGNASLLCCPGSTQSEVLCGQGVLPDSAAGKTFDGIFHLVDYYATFAT
jgi:hypothetical protein